MEEQQDGKAIEIKQGVNVGDRSLEDVVGDNDSESTLHGEA